MLLSPFKSSIFANVNDHTIFNIVTNLYLNSFKYTVLLSWMHQLLNRSLDC